MIYTFPRHIAIISTLVGQLHADTCPAAVSMGNEGGTLTSLLIVQLIATVAHYGLLRHRCTRTILTVLSGTQRLSSNLNNWLPC